MIVLSHSPKEVSSSEAHERVLSSPDYATRPDKARKHLKLLLEAFYAEKWMEAYEICWEEFHDMHALFSSCKIPFHYITPQGQALLNELKHRWLHEGDGPLVTMDAGPNIHLLYRSDQSDLARVFKQDVLIGNYDVL